MEIMQSFIGKLVELEISGRGHPVKGTLVDIGNDILVVRNATQFLYIPLVHLQYISLNPNPDEVDEEVAESPFENGSDISYRKILMNARGMFIELFITGNQTIHGYLTSIMNDYFVFNSPVFRTVFISMNHLKYLIPYHPNVTPYALKQEKFPLNPNPIPLARTFDQQLKKLEGEFVVIDLGENPNKIGQLKSVQNNMLELVTSNGESVFMHFDHVKTVHVP
ncbi:DUF2642 domain-containing protein [Paenibacillus hamazuiensis]|uniref:DUF2642 domain-containing protein n=1 Tax=Paenibacillus hamazuiensis TaxID=2936508 RepID=UPI00200DEBFC|nr:DUF2642 domain-containing protein [Paenibacillus hamazuiensis]